MKIHEYQARQWLAQCQVPICRGEAVFDPKDAPDAFRRLANPQCMVKVQVLMGGRGKAGGVQRAKNPEEAQKLAASFIGNPFSTYQSQGKPAVVKSVMITEQVAVKEEYYLGIVIDRSKGLPVILFSREGGVEIEEVAHSNPEAIEKIYFSPSNLPTKKNIALVIQNKFLDPEIPAQIADIASKLAAFFVQKDASVCEINPLVLTTEGRVLALDAKMTFDDNALFSHENIQSLKDPDEEDERERKAKEFGLSYVSMSGNVGCLVNGAGLAMATMDMIKLASGEPANFLDVGGSATADQVREGFKIILKDSRVAALLVNIFGGIMKCDVIAEGVIQALREIPAPACRQAGVPAGGKLQVPLVVRLEGTRVEEGRQLLKQSNLPIISCATIQEAAKRAVKEAEKASRSVNVHSH